MRRRVAFGERGGALPVLVTLAGPGGLAGLVLLVALAAPIPAHGAALTSALELTTTATVEGDVYAQPGEPDARLAGRLQLEPLWAPVTWGELSASVDLSVDSDGEIDASLAPDWREQSLEPRSLAVTELAAAAHLAAVDVTLGKLVASWGIGDLLQPSDSITPRDLTDPLRDRRLGAPGVVAELYPGDLELSVAVMRHAPHRLPQVDYRWFPIADPGGIEVASELPAGGGAAIVAGRLRGWERWFDWTLTLRRGPDLAPHLRLGGARPLLVYPDMTLAGGSVSVARGRLVLRAAASWRRYDREGGRAVEEDFATLLAGGERRFPRLVLGTDATLIVELVRDQHVAGPRLPREIAVLDPLRLFATGLSARLLTHNPTGWEAEAGLAADLAAGGGIVQLLVRRNLGDRVDIELGIDLLGAGGNRALEPVADNDRATLRVVSHL